MRSNQEFVSTSRPGYLQECFLKFRVYEWRFERFNYAVAEQKKIFGTDGVRGVANVEPVTAETALKLGRAAAYVFAQMNPRRTPDGARPKIVLGKDTRLSGYMLENALVAGITSLESMCWSSDRWLHPALLTSLARCVQMPASSSPHRITPIRTTASNFSGTTVTSWTIRSRKKSSSLFSRAKLISSGRLPTKSDVRRESMTRSGGTWNS